MLVPRFLSPIWLHALQNSLSKPQQEMTPVALQLFFDKISYGFFCRCSIQHSFFFLTCYSFGWISEIFPVETLHGSCLRLKRLKGRIWHIENNCYGLRFSCVISTCDATVIHKCCIYQVKLFLHSWVFLAGTLQRFGQDGWFLLWKLCMSGRNVRYCRIVPHHLSARSLAFLVKTGP